MHFFDTASLNVSLKLFRALFWPLFEGSELLWRTPGKDVAIQCRLETQDEVQSLSVTRGLAQDDVFHVEADSKDKPLIKDPFHGRLQYSGTYPNLDILIKNLYLNDTGPYWCICRKVNKIKRETTIVKTKGSVLLVVSGKPSSISLVITLFPPIRSIPPRYHII